MGLVCVRRTMRVTGAAGFLGSPCEAFRGRLTPGAVAS
jgi:hypothetical protein